MNDHAFEQATKNATETRYMYPAYSGRPRVGDKVTAYTLATTNQFGYFHRLESCKVLVEYARSAYLEKKPLLLALHKTDI